MMREINELYIQIAIESLPDSDKRDLVFAFRGVEYPVNLIKPQAVARFSIPPVNETELAEGMKYAMVYNKRQGAWECLWIIVTGLADKGEWFTYSEFTPP